jgi:hypothetical protein
MWPRRDSARLDGQAAGLRICDPPELPPTAQLGRRIRRRPIFSASQHWVSASEASTRPTCCRR